MPAPTPRHAIRISYTLARKSVARSCAIAILAGCPGCASMPTPARMPTPEERAKAITVRAEALRDEVAKKNRVDADDQRAVDSVIADVRAYNADTKRFNLSVERAISMTPCREGVVTSAREIDPKNPKPCDPECAPFYFEPPMTFCFEDGTSFCNQKGKVCSYRCVRIPVEAP